MVELLQSLRTQTRHCGACASRGLLMRPALQPGCGGRQHCLRVSAGDGYHSRRRRQRERAQRHKFERADENFYEVLGVESNWEPAEIKRSYHQTMKENHPDVAGARSLEFCTRANRAAECLLDEECRVQHDRFYGLHHYKTSQGRNHSWKRRAVKFEPSCEVADFAAVSEQEQQEQAEDWIYRNATVGEWAIYDSPTASDGDGHEERESTKASAMGSENVVDLNTFRKGVKSTQDGSSVSSRKEMLTDDTQQATVNFVSEAKEAVQPEEPPPQARRSEDLSLSHQKLMPAFAALAVAACILQITTQSVLDARVTSNGNQRAGAPATGECYERGGGLCRFIGN